MKIVVTGGSGMVGKNIEDLILNDREYFSHSFVFLNRSKKNKFSLDLTNRNDVIRFFKNNSFDYIIHLAANVGGLFKNLKNNTKIFNDNIRINENILEACHKNNIQRGIFCLSSCIFPYNPVKFPMTEKNVLDSEPHYSNRGYGFSKRMLYVQCQNYNKDFGREYICVSPANIYGKYDNFSLENGHFIPAIIHRFHRDKNKKELIAYGSGSPLRQLVYAGDIAKIICILLFNKELTKDNDIFNICNEEEYTIKEYIYKICDLLNIDNSKIFWDTSKSDGCIKKTVSNNLLKKTIPNYKFTNLDKGLYETYKWFKKNYDTCRK